MWDRPRRVRIIIIIILLRWQTQIEKDLDAAIEEALSTVLARALLMYEVETESSIEASDALHAADVAFVTLADYVQQNETALNESTLQSLSDSLADALDNTDY